MQPAQFRLADHPLAFRIGQETLPGQVQGSPPLLCRAQRSEAKRLRADETGRYVKCPVFSSWSRQGRAAKNVPLPGKRKSYPSETECQNPNPCRITTLFDRPGTTCSQSLDSFFPSYHFLCCQPIAILAVLSTHHLWQSNCGVVMEEADLETWGKPLWRKDYDLASR